jgi:hypothetical protein
MDVAVAFWGSLLRLEWYAGSFRIVRMTEGRPFSPVLPF